MPTYLLGASVGRVPGPRYFEHLAFAEVAPRHPIPRPSVLARWRKAAPESARFTLLAPASMWSSPQGAFRDDPKTSAGARWIVDAGAAVGADAIVLATGAELTPGPRDRERFAAWCAHLIAASGRTVVWQPGGLWEAEEAEAFARSLGVACAFDPLEGPAPRGSIAYGRVRALGARARLGDGLLRALVDTLADAEGEVRYLAIESEDAVRKARRAQDMIEGLEATGGADRLRRAGGTVLDLGDGLDEDEDEDDLDEDEDEDEDDLDEDEDDLDEDEDEDDLDEDEDEDEA